MHPACLPAGRQADCRKRCRKRGCRWRRGQPSTVAPAQGAPPFWRPCTWPSSPFRGLRTAGTEPSARRRVASWCARSCASGRRGARSQRAACCKDRIASRGAAPPQPAAQRNRPSSTRTRAASVPFPHSRQRNICRGHSRCAAAARCRRGQRIGRQARQLTCDPCA
eukprot:scaffold68200_cov63-Phaeocystis_antarctica.AAC.1